MFFLGEIFIFYNTMTTGEKRSLTNSLNKYSNLFIENIQGDFLSFGSKEKFLDAFYSYWIDSSKKSKVSWCKTTPYYNELGFKSEILPRISDLFVDEINIFEKQTKMNVKSDKIAPLRSKKKRLKKKRLKMLQTV